MPELPEVETICKALSPHLINQKFLNCVVRNGSLRYQINEKIINNFIHQQKIKNIYRRAKYIILLFESNQGLCIHLGMTGSLRIVAKIEPYYKHEHISFLFNGNLQLRYCDPRRFGFILPFDTYQKLPFLQKLGIEPFDKKFCSQYIFTITRTKNYL